MSIETKIICGQRTIIAQHFNERTTVQQIRDCINRSDGKDIVQPYRILLYDPLIMDLIDLEDRLKSEPSPFGLPVVDDISSRGRISFSPVQLIIVRDRSKQSTDPLDNEMFLPDEIAFDCNDSASGSHDDHDMESSSSEQSMANNDHSGGSISSHIDIMESTSDRPFFSLDVQPNQKPIYRSDEFGIRPRKCKGLIACLQGLKDSSQQRRQVLPKIRLPAVFRHSSNPDLKLLVAAVSETSDGEVRRWFIHRDRQFIPEGYTRDTQGINPIAIDLNPTPLTEEGDFQLKLRMVKEWDKSSTSLKEEFYALPEAEAARLHPARHLPSVPRLCCVLQLDDTPLWTTMCLSDFIRPPKYTPDLSTTPSD